VSRTLFVAAGGGGDAIAAAMVHGMRSDDRPVIATWAWERAVIDPVPGPRSPADFDGLDEPAPGVPVITAGSAARPPSGSCLPGLAGALDATLVLLDPRRGGAGLAAQIEAVARWTDADSVHVVDAGGDALGLPGDPGLHSPMADVSSVAAVAAMRLPADLTVLGPGADGELLPDLVRDRLAGLGARHAGVLDAEAARRHLPLLDGNPSEANAVLIAAASGVRGAVEMREGALPVTLEPGMAGAWTVDLQAVPRAGVHDVLARTTTLAELRSRSAAIFGIDEIGREQAADPIGPRPVDVDEVLGAARERGADWLTRYRFGELTAFAITDPGRLGDHWQPPLIATGHDPVGRGSC
jgi:hypothetical protein